MNSKLIASVSLGVFNLGIIALKIAADRHAKKVSAEKAIETRAKEAADLFKEAQKNCDIFKERTAKEKAELGRLMKDWRVANDFDGRKKDILDSVSDGLREFKSQIGYSDKMEEIDSAFESSLEAFKNTIDYDGVKAGLEKEIADAKKHYESQKAVIATAGDDISDTAMKLRHAAEESMTNKVKEAKGKLEALEKQLSDETDKLKKIKTEDIRVLEEKVSKEKARLNKKSDKDLEKLNEELSKAQDDILKKIRKGRSDEEKAAFLTHEDDVRLIREQRTADANAANDILDKMPTHERFAEYLHANKVPKFVVIAVSILPLIPIGYLGWHYAKFVCAVVKAM